MELDDAVELLKNYPNYKDYLINLFLSDRVLSDQLVVLRDTHTNPQYPYLSEEYTPLINAGYMTQDRKITHSGYKALEVFNLD